MKKCMLCEIEELKGICYNCLRQVMATERYQNDVIPFLKKKYNKAGRKKGTPQSQETKDKIRQALLARHASNA